MSDEFEVYKRCGTVEFPGGFSFRRFSASDGKFLLGTPTSVSGRKIFLDSWLPLHGCISKLLASKDVSGWLSGHLKHVKNCGFMIVTVMSACAFCTSPGDLITHVLAFFPRYIQEVNQSSSWRHIESGKPLTLLRCLFACNILQHKVVV